MAPTKGAGRPVPSLQLSGISMMLLTDTSPLSLSFKTSRLYRITLDIPPLRLVDRLSVSLFHFWDRQPFQETGRHGGSVERAQAEDGARGELQAALEVVRLPVEATGTGQCMPILDNRAIVVEV